MALAAALCGCNNWWRSPELGRRSSGVAGQYLELKHGTASHHTFGACSVCHCTVFETPALANGSRPWWALLAVVAIDGKTLCGWADRGEHMALHMVSAFATDTGVCLGRRVPAARGTSSKVCGRRLGAPRSRAAPWSPRLGLPKDIAGGRSWPQGDDAWAVKDNQAV